MLLLAGCGSGLITGVVASSDSRRPAPPELTLLQGQLPLSPSPGTTVTVGISNAEIGAGASLAVTLVAGAFVVPQRSPVLSVQSGTTSVTFTLVTDGMPRTGDLAGTIVVVADSRQIGQPVPVQLVRQPIAELAQTGPIFVSAGGERIELLVDGLRSTQASQLQVLVHVSDPAAPPDAGARGRITRPATSVELGDSVDGRTEVFAVLPGNTFPVQAQVEVVDAVAGVSTAIYDLFYRPAIDLLLPSQGSTSGGGELRLIGTALVPHDFDAAGAAPLAFEDVELSLSKGGRTTTIDRVDFLTTESNGGLLVFRLPPSPDGRPGQVDVVLRVGLVQVLPDGQRTRVTAQVTASEAFLFANPDPFFGPRGTVLEQLPVAVAPILLDNAPATDGAPDFVSLTEQGGVAFVQLLLAQQNGMFQRFGAPRQVGDHEQVAERTPRDLCVGDFDGDLIPDVFVVNQGAAAAVHHVVLGQARPLPPLGTVHRIAAAGGSVRARAADFDGDQLLDVLLVPGPEAAPLQRPQLLLARPIGVGQPGFAQPIDVPVRAFRYDAVEVADLDGDGALDVAVVSGTTGALDVAYGLGNGGFAPAVELDFVVPNYTFAPESPAVGLHACADGPRQSLALVLAGLAVPSPPTVTVLRQPVARQYAAPLAGETLSQSLPPIAASVVDDIDRQGTIEMVVALRDVPQFPLLLLQLGANGFQLLADGIVGGSESARQIRSLTTGRAFPATPLSGEARAVFLVHETDIGANNERRLSTRLVTKDTALPQILPPDAGAQVEFAVENVVGGNFHDISVAGGGAVRDLALVRPAVAGSPPRIVLITNDGFGGFPGLGTSLPFPDLLGDSLALLPAPTGQRDRLLFGRRDSSFAVWLNGSTLPLPISPPLRAASADPVLQVTALGAATRVVVGDVDGDGFDDAVVLLSFDLSGEGQAALALLRGKVAVGEGEFPFHVPTALTPVHGNASGLVLADFARDALGPTQLELAVAVPNGSGNGGGVDGNHVRFFRYQSGAAPAEDRLVPAAAVGGPQVLLAGSGPTQVAAADFDRDGGIDLLVACRSDQTLRLFRNTAVPGTVPGVVQVGAFVEAPDSPWQLDPGEPRRLQLADVNGDGSIDAAVMVEFTSTFGGQRSTTVATYLSSGTGELVGPRFVSPQRLGNRNARLSCDLGDWNRDGVPDLFLGWNTFAPGDINLRVLFGGTR